MGHERGPCLPRSARPDGQPTSWADAAESMYNEALYQPFYALEWLAPIAPIPRHRTSEEPYGRARPSRTGWGDAGGAGTRRRAAQAGRAPAGALRRGAERHPRSSGAAG